MNNKLKVTLIILRMNCATNIVYIFVIKKTLLELSKLLVSPQIKTALHNVSNLCSTMRNCKVSYSRSAPFQ